MAVYISEHAAVQAGRFRQTLIGRRSRPAFDPPPTFAPFGMR